MPIRLIVDLELEGGEGSDEQYVTWLQGTLLACRQVSGLAVILGEYVPAWKTAYVAAHGINCPRIGCKGKAFIPEDANAYRGSDEDILRESCQCDLCGATWTDVYKLTNLEDLQYERPEFPFGEFDNGKHWKGEF